MPRLAPRLLIVGWDAADWKIIDPLLAAGAMPHLKRLIDAGFRADLSSLDPKLSPLLWTSIATGKTADKHGILHFIEPDPAGSGMRVSTSTTRRTKALWNILTQSNLTSRVVSWYASHPAEPIRGTIVSNLFQEGMPGPVESRWPLLAGAVHPPSLADSIAELRMHVGELHAEELLALLPGLSRMDRSDPRVLVAAKIISQCASVHNVATSLLGNGEPWDCMLVFHEAIDVAGHHFMQYYPPRMDHVSPQDFAFFRHVIPGVYHLMDAMLGTLVQLAGPQSTVLVLSDHGFHSDHLRPRTQASLNDPHAAMDATWHRPLGMLAGAGPGFRKGAAVYGANLLDITPTALTLLGLPIGADMDGRVLVEALTDGTVERVFSWDDVSGEAGMHAPGMRIDPVEARDAMAQLADLGYVSGTDADNAAACDRETRFNLGVVFMTTSRPRQALEVFEKLTREYPGDPRFAMNHAHCLYAAGKHEEAIASLDLFAKVFPNNPDATLLRGAALFAQGRVKEAATALEAAVLQSPDRPDLLCTIADAYTHLKRFDEASATLQRAENLDPHNPVVHLKRSQLLLAREQFEAAAEAALRAVELKHFYPEAHYLLGVALTWLKDYPHAIQSFKVALSMQPGMIDANRYIASIYRHLDDRMSARPYRDAAEQLLASREAGDPAGVPAMLEPPLGPQEWARRLGVSDRE